jgi:uncharacterized HAD superfamily protein
MRTQPVIGVDIDGVLYNFHGAMTQLAKQLYGIDIDYEATTDYHVENCSFLTKDEVRDIVVMPQAYQIGETYDYAAELTASLSRLGFALVMVTDRPTYVLEATVDWMDKNNIYSNAMFFTKAHEKPKLAAMNGIPYFIEDRLDTAVNLCEVCRMVFLVDRPWNRNGETWPKNLVRVFDPMNIVIYIRENEKALKVVEIPE